MTPMFEGESPDAAQARMMKLGAQLLPLLDNYIPDSSQKAVILREAKSLCTRLAQSRRSKTSTGNSYPWIRISQRQTASQRKSRRQKTDQIRSHQRILPTDSAARSPASPCR